MSVLGQLAKVAKAKPLRSTLDEAVEALQRKQGTGQAFVNDLLKNPAIKPAELKERGLDKVLSSLPKVDKAEIQKAVKSKPVAKLEQRIASENPYDDPEVRKRADELISYEADAMLENDASRKQVHDFVSDAEEYNYDKYLDEASKELGARVEHDSPEHQLPNGTNYREIKLKLPQSSFVAEPHHFNKEPGILAHMRITDRAGPNGEKVLHLEELQSDWHQKGRDIGYHDPEKLAQSEATINALKDEHRRLGKLKDQVVTPEEKEAISLQRHSIMSKIRDAAIMPSSHVPDAPFKKNWHEVALKKLINYATENGYDKIAITPGAEQFKRWNTGEEGMKRFYDQTVPEYLNKLGSPHGSEVQLHTMPVDTGGYKVNMDSHTELPYRVESTNSPDILSRHATAEDAWNEANKLGQTHLHTFDLTPSLKNEVTQKGLPLYQQIGIPLGGAEAVNLAQPEPEMKRGGKVSISNNPDAMFMELADRKFAGGGAIRKIVEKLGTKIIPMAEAEANKAKFLEPSKVKDRMYHATNADFKSFRPSHRGAHFVTPDRDFANGHIGSDGWTSGIDNFEEGANIMPVHVQVQNPFDYEKLQDVKNLFRQAKKDNVGLDRDWKEGILEGNWDALEREKLMRSIKNLGHDAMYVSERDDSGETIKNLGIFEPNKIKSAIGNQGTYDITNPDITKKSGGAIRKMANGGGLPSMEYDPEQVPVNFYKHGNKMMTGDADVSMGGMGLASNVGNDSLNLALNSSDIKKYIGDRQMMNALMANYAHKMGDTKLMANVMSPQGMPVKNINLMASTPIGEGTATLGAHGSHGYGQKQLNALSANYNLPLEHGNLNANISRSLADKKNTVNLNYVMPFKDGGSVDRHYGIGGALKALTPMEEAFAKMAKAKEAMKANAEMNRLYEEATKDMYTKDMPSFEAWKKTLPPPEVK